MSGFLRRIVGEGIENRFVFIVSVILTISLLAVILVVLQHSHAELYTDIGQRTMLSLNGFRYVLKGRELPWTIDVVKRLNLILRKQGAVVFLWLEKGQKILGADLSLPKMDEHQLITDKYPRELPIGQDRYIMWSIPVKLKNELRGRLVIAHSTDFLYKRLLLLTWKLLLISVALIIVSFFLGKTLAGRVLKPLKRFILAMDKVAQGEFPYENADPEMIEMGKWSDTFNEMVRQLREKHMMEALLFEQEKMASVGHLAASVAHEIRNPLASISSLTQLIAGLHQDDLKIAEYTDVVLKEVDRLNQAIQQLLNFARPVPTCFAECSLAEVLDGVLLLLSFEAQGAGISIIRNIPDDGRFIVWADANQLKQVFINLLSNAFQALNGRGGKVVVSVLAVKDNENVEVHFQDDGDGIPEDTKEKIFDPFFSTRKAGIGLGLAISKKIMNAHGGDIIADKPAGGKGALFRVILPLGGGIKEGEEKLADVHEVEPREIR